MKNQSRELLIAILKSDLSSKFKEEILREMFLPKNIYGKELKGERTYEDRE